MRVLAAFNRTATILVTAKTSILRLPLPHHSGQDVVCEWALPDGLILYGAIVGDSKKSLKDFLSQASSRQERVQDKMK